MRGSILTTLLESFSGTAQASADLLVAFLSAGHGASYGKLQRAMGLLADARDRARFEAMRRQRYYEYLARLKRDGLIRETGGGRKRMLALTRKGKEKLNILHKEQKDALPPRHYEKIANERVVIVTFDIPESEKRKRNWLRRALRELGLRMIHKSVWMGSIKLPARFVTDLNNLRITDYVEVFEVSKTGTLRHVV
ncbi:MAG: CRISPR-associated endonuclease Cas2 [Patescibacteria group bacterium]